MDWLQERYWTWEVGLIVAAMVVFGLLMWLWDATYPCPACRRKWMALEPTGKVERHGGLLRDDEEYRCKHCGETVWRKGPSKIRGYG